MLIYLFSEWSAEQISHAIGVANRLNLIPPVAEQPQVFPLPLSLLSFLSFVFFFFLFSTSFLLFFFFCFCVLTKDTVQHVAPHTLRARVQHLVQVRQWPWHHHLESSRLWFVNWYDEDEEREREGEEGDEKRERRRRQED